MHTDPLYIRKHLIVPKLNLTAICLTTTKTSMLDMKTPGDRGTNTSIGNFFPVINPFRYLQQVPSFPFEFGWVQHCSVTALSARLNRHLKPLVFCSWMYLSHHLSTSLQARAVHVDLLQGKSMELIERVQPCTNEPGKLS